MHVRTTSTIRTMPVGRVSDLNPHATWQNCFKNPKPFYCLDFQCFWSLETALHSSKHLCAVSQCHKCQQIQSNSFFSSRCPLVFLFHRDSLKSKFFVVKLQFLLMWQHTRLIMLTLTEAFRAYHIYDLSLGSHWLLVCCCPYELIPNPGLWSRARLFLITSTYGLQSHLKIPFGLITGV